MRHDPSPEVDAIHGYIDEGVVDEDVVAQDAVWQDPLGLDGVELLTETEYGLAYDEPTTFDEDNPSSDHGVDPYTGAPIND